MISTKRTVTVILVLLTLVSALFHFYNLNWGAPFYFHPDERNIASSVSQLQFPNQLNPHFFAYGSLPIYLIYLTGLFGNLLTGKLTNHILFEQAIFISRFYSALFATLLVPILFVIARSIATKQSPTGSPRFARDDVGLIAAFLAATSVGFIQFAHFGTFEMWLTFFSVILFWLSLQKITPSILVGIGITLGILLATKVSSLVLFFIPLFVLPAHFLVHKQKNKFVIIGKIFMSMCGIVACAIFTYIITNPYVFLSFKEFRDSMQYESGVALGTLPVFYTGEFFSSIPILFQFLHVYPFLLNIVITILFVPACAYLVIHMIREKNMSYVLLITFFLILFLSQAFFYVKWTRYMVPTLPFIYLIVSIALADISVIARNKMTKQSQTRLPRASYALAMTTILFLCFIFATSYFITAFVKLDTRVSAAQFATRIIPPETPILSEIYDMGIVPFNDTFRHITLFHFYDLDNNSPLATQQVLELRLQNSQYLILPSQRILKTRLLDKNHFPLAHAFYQSLLSEKNGYKKIYETPCDIFCQVAYLGSPVFRFEETANVFDRPTIMIFKKDIQ